MNVLIAGCGYVGSQLAAELVADGTSVHALKRNPDGLPRGVRGIACDLTDAVRVAAAVPSGLDAVVYCAAPGGGSEEDYEKTYVQGLSNVLAALAGQGQAPALFFTSSTAVYAQLDGSVVDESSQTEPTHYSGQITLRAERLVLEAGLRGSVLRCGGIYGPGRTRLIDAVRAGRATYSATVETFTNRVHRDDIAGAIRFLLQRPAPAPVYVLVDEDPASRREVLSWLAERMNAPLPQGVEEFHAGRRDSRSNKRCSSALLRQAGYVFRYSSYRDGYGAMLAELGF